MNNDWLNTDDYQKAAVKYGNAVLAQVEGESDLQELSNEASFDAGFEAGVLASEAGLGRADA